jgi:hypothetical protein
METTNYEERPITETDHRLAFSLGVLPLSVIQTKYCDGLDEECPHPMPLFNLFSTIEELDLHIVLN